MEQQKTILEGYSDLEKGAYLGAIASIATADRTATEEELEYLEALAESAQLSGPQTEMIKRAATELTQDELHKCLDILKSSELRFSLIADMITFAESDKEYSADEKQRVKKAAEYLGVNQEQFSLLDQFTHKAAEAKSPEEVSNQNFLSGTGLGDKMKSAGINPGGLLKGMLGVMGPILLAGMLSGGRRRGGGLMGGMPGGGGGMFGGGAGMGGLGSLIGMLGGSGLGRSRGLGRSFGF